jgi:hypothetical protein
VFTDRGGKTVRSAFARLGLVAVASLPLMGAGSPQLRVQVRTDKLTVQADRVPLYGVLWAISAQTGIRLDLKGGTGSADVPVTEDFEDVPLEQGMIRLLKKYLGQSSYIPAVDKRTGAVQAVQVLAPSGGAPLPSSGSGRAAEIASPPGTPGGENAAARKDYVSQALEAARAASTLDARVKAIRDLGIQDPRVLTVLHPALASEEPEVREAALQAMRWATVDDADALADVRSLIVQDPESGVRQAALEVLIRYDHSPEARALLEKLATEPGGALAARARKELDRLDWEARARALPDTQVNPQLAPK